MNSSSYFNSRFPLFGNNYCMVLLCNVVVVETNKNTRQNLSYIKSLIHLWTS